MRDGRIAPGWQLRDCEDKLAVALRVDRDGPELNQPWVVQRSDSDLMRGDADRICRGEKYADRWRAGGNAGKGAGVERPRRDLVARGCLLRVQLQPEVRLR